MSRRWWTILIALALSAPALGKGVYQEPRDFLGEVFAGDVPKPRLLWITQPLRPTIREIMGHDLRELRVRYWGRNGRTAWILEEIGKEHPITTGIVVDAGRIERIRVLIFREIRGWEVRYPFFTDQFPGTGLQADTRLDRSIDGITGATLSVRALKKLARLALYLHRHAEPDDGAP